MLAQIHTEDCCEILYQHKCSGNTVQNKKLHIRCNGCHNATQNKIISIKCTREIWYLNSII